MTAPTPSAAQVLGPFPPRILDLLRYVADRNPPAPHGPFEDRDGTPLQDDADAALAWIAAALSTLPAEPEGWRLVPTWANCETRGPWVRNSLKSRIAKMKADEARLRRAFNKPYMGEPTKWYADALGDATAVLESALAALSAAPLEPVKGGAP